jgi:hypothetical protein
VSPAFSGDDASVVFAGRTSLYRIIRTKIDDRKTDTIATPPPWPPNYGAPGDPSPDGAYTTYAEPAASVNGRYVSYTGWAPCCVAWIVYVKDLQTHTATKIPTRETAKWLGSTDSLVAHVWEGFDIVRPDGTRVRGISYPMVRTLGGMRYDASPDGKWLAVSADIARDGPRVIELVDLSTGMRLPLGFTGDMGSPAWRPE